MNHARRRAAARGSAAPSRHRRGSFPGIMAVGGFFFGFEPFRTASRSSRGATGETSGTAPERGLRGARRRGGRHATPARRRRAPGRLGQPRGPRAVPRRPRTGAVDVIACKRWDGLERSERSTSTPSTRRVRRSTAPEWLAGCNGCFMLCVRRGAGPRGGRWR